MFFNPEHDTKYLSAATTLLALGLITVAIAIFLAPVRPTKINFGECVVMSAIATGNSVQELKGIKGHLTVLECKQLIQAVQDCECEKSVEENSNAS